jgi:cell division protein FtsB
LRSGYDQSGDKSVRRGFVALLGFTFAVMNIGIFRGPSGVNDYIELEKSRDVLSKAVENLKTENEAISEEINRIKSSPQYARKILRDKYHVTEEDEDIIFFAE